MDVRGNTVKLNDGTQISYDKCLIATGKFLGFFLFVLRLVTAFLFQWHLFDKKVSTVCVRHLAEQSHEGQSYRQPRHWVFHLPHISQLLWDVQSFALCKSAGKEEKVTSPVAQQGAPA